MQRLLYVFGTIIFLPTFLFVIMCLLIMGAFHSEGCNEWELEEAEERDLGLH